MGWAFNVSGWLRVECCLPFKWVDLKACGHWAFGYKLCFCLLFYIYFFGSLLGYKVEVHEWWMEFPRANRWMMGLMAMVGLTAGACAMDFVDGGRMGSWWRLSSSDGLEQGDNCGFCAIWVIVLGVGWLWGESLWCFDHCGWLDLGRLGDFRFVGMDANWLILLVPVMVSWILVWKSKIVMDWGLLWY